MGEKLIETFERFEIWNSDNMANIGTALLNKIFETNDSPRIAVSVRKTDDVGYVSSNDIFIYDSYTDSLEKINKFEYSRNTSVDVYEINQIGYSSIFTKAYNSVCYSRLAGVKLHKYELSDVRKLFNCSSSIYICS